MPLPVKHLKVNKWVGISIREYNDICVMSEMCAGCRRELSFLLGGVGKAGDCHQSAERSGCSLHRPGEEKHIWQLSLREAHNGSVSASGPTLT